MDGEIGQSLKWSAIAVFAVRALSAIRSLTIARVVGPRSVGTFAAAFAFVSLASLVTEFGLQSFLVQRGSRARADAVAVAQLALTMGALSCTALLFAARPIANFYDDGAIAGLVVALTVSVAFTALAVVPSALLRADLRFDAVARASVLAEAAACVVGVGFAVNGAGVWSLVAAALTSQFVTLVALLASRPAWERSERAGRSRARGEALRFGIGIASGSVVWTFALQGDNVAVGRVLGAASLGLYAFAYNYGVMPGGLVGSTVTDVALAGFSNAESDKERASLLTQFVRVGAAAASPLVLISLAIVPAGIRLVLGSEWLDATKPLQVLLIVGWVRGVLPVEALLRSKGLVSAELKVGLFAAPLTVFAAYIGAQTSLLAAAVAVGVVLISASVAVTWLATQAVETTIRSVGRAAAPSVLVCALCTAPLLLNEVLRLTPDAVAVFVGGPLGLAACVLAIRRFLPKEWESLVSVASSRRPPVPT